MLAHRLRRCTNIKPTLVERLVLAGLPIIIILLIIAYYYNYYYYYYYYESCSFVSIFVYYAYLL